VEFFRLFHWGKGLLTGKPGTLNGQRKKELPALKELVKRTSMQDIFEEVELVFTKDKGLAKN
jgi:hypothetical protein